MDDEKKTQEVEKNQDNLACDSRVKKSFSIWCWLALVSLLCGAFTFYKGIDRMINYDNGEHYPYDLVNAYVGGDAYNYIINGTHATAFFVLTTMFVLAGIGFIIIHYLSRIDTKAGGKLPGL